MPTTIKNKRIIANVFLRDFPNNFVIKAPMPNEGIENPPIIKAIIFAIGIKIIAGKKIMAWALGGQKSKPKVSNRE